MRTKPLPAVVLAIAFGILLTACRSASIEPTETSSTDVSQVIEESSFATCSRSIAPIIARAIDANGDINELARTYGADTPTFAASVLIVSEVMQTQFSQGLNAAGEQLSTYSINACLDGDIANQVLGLSSGDSGFVSNCLDGKPPAQFESSVTC